MTAVTAHPAGIAACVIVAVERELIAPGTQREALGIVAAIETGERVTVGGVGWLEPV